MRRPEIGYDDLVKARPDLPPLDHQTKSQVEVEIKYDGYIKRQLADEKRFRRMEDQLLPEDWDYLAMSGLRIEARQKLDRARPEVARQASRIPGVSPGDISVLMIDLERKRRKADAR